MAESRWNSHSDTENILFCCKTNPTVFLFTSSNIVFATFWPTYPLHVHNDISRKSLGNFFGVVAHFNLIQWWLMRLWWSKAKDHGYYDPQSIPFLWKWCPRNLDGICSNKLSIRTLENLIKTINELSRICHFTELEELALYTHYVFYYIDIHMSNEWMNWIWCTEVIAYIKLRILRWVAVSETVTLVITLGGLLHCGLHTVQNISCELQKEAI